MRKAIVVALFLLLSALVPAGQPFLGAAAAAAQEAAAPRPMTVDDALAIVNVGTGLITSDGSHVLYTERRLDWDDNEYKTEVFMVAADGGEAWRYLGEDGGSDFAFSPDGAYLTFKRRAGEGKAATQQLFWMRTTGGEAVQLTEHATSVSRYRWSADSAHLYFAADDEIDKKTKGEIDKGDDIIFVDEGPNGQSRDQWSNLWRFDVETKEETQLTDEEFLVGDFDVSPDGLWVAMTARSTNRRNDGDKTEIFLLDLETLQRTRLTDNAAPEGGLLWAPDSRRFLYQAADDQQWLNRNTKLWVMEAALAEHRLLSGAFAGNVGQPAWTPDGKHVLFSGTEGARSNVFRLDAETGEVERITDLDGSLRVSSWSADRSRFAYAYSDFDSPGDLWAGDVANFAPMRLTDANPQLAELALASMQLVRWESHDGTEIEGLLHLPPGYEAGEPLPLMLNIHGGPAGVFTNSFRASYHLYAGLGWAALSPNVRGSCCYDDTLREGNTVARQDGIGFGDYQDLMTGVDAMIERGIADPERLALRGWSYGGILGGWTITQTDRFKAASIGAGVYDWTSEYGPGFNNDVRLWHIGGTPWDNPEGYRNQSALTHVANITTPTLLIHGMNDTTDTEPQSMMLFAAIKDIGKAPVRYLRAPREPHGFREPRHQRRRDVEEIRWMQLHALGLEWEPWERPAKAEEDADSEAEEAADETQ